MANDLIRFRCPQCGNSIEVDDSLAGRRGRCQQCEIVIRIPSEEPPQLTDGGPVTGRNVVTFILAGVSVVLLVTVVILAGKYGKAKAQIDGVRDEAAKQVATVRTEIETIRKDAEHQIAEARTGADRRVEAAQAKAKHDVADAKRTAADAIARLKSVQREAEQRIASLKSARKKTETAPSRAQPMSPGSAEDVVRSYMEAKMIKDRRRLCHLGQLSEDIFERYYGKHPYHPNKVKSTRQVRQDEVEVSYVTHEGVQRRDSYYLVRHEGKLLIDWPRSLGVNAVTLNTFDVTQPESPAAFWVVGELSTYYNYTFDNPDLWQSVHVFEMNDGSTGTGYILKSDPACSELVRYLNRGQRMTVLLLPPGERKPHRQFIILAWKPGYVSFSEDEVLAAMNRFTP